MERSHGQFCTVARSAQVLCERWTPLVLRELLCGSRRFNDLHRGVPGMSSSLRAQRLRQLEEENNRLNRIVADLSLDKEMLQDVIRRKL